MIAGKYRLQKQLARGGMGEVWTARNLQLNIPVAIKFMSPETIGSAELVGRFEREALAAAQMRSPHVVQIYEHGVVEGTPYMVMELLDGEDLSKRLKARGRLTMIETVWIVGSVCKALRRAHEMGIVHRDLKPANVFLCKQDEEELVKVLDFGVAKMVLPGPDEELTKTDTLVGTPHYMSPEQARRNHKQVDHRTDLWAAGVIAYRALTGKLPFAGDTSIDVLIRICDDREAIPSASSVAPDLGPHVDRFFAKALARDPAARFQSAREMAEALNVLGGPPSVAAETPRPLGSSWNESGRPPAAPGVERGSSRPAVSMGTRAAPHPGPPTPAAGLSAVGDPGAVAGRPGASGTKGSSGRVSTPVESPKKGEKEDTFDGAETVPIARSPVGQAVAKRAELLRTQRLPSMPYPPAESQPDRSSASPAPGNPAMTTGGGSAGDVAGTITSATAETVIPTRGRRKGSVVIWAAGGAIIIALGVVAWAVVTGVQQAGAGDSGESLVIPVTTGSATAPMPTLVRPLDPVPSATAEAPRPGPSVPSPTVAPTGSGSKVAPSLTATATPSVRPTAPPPKTPKVVPTVTPTARVDPVTPQF